MYVIIISDAFISMFAIQFVYYKALTLLTAELKQANLLLSVQDVCPYAMLVLHVQKSQTFFQLSLQQNAVLQPIFSQDAVSAICDGLPYALYFIVCLLVGPWPTAVLAHFVEVQMVVGHIWNLRLLKVE